jgi:ribosomal protein S12 methylthiotransferase accessory factor
MPVELAERPFLPVSAALARLEEAVSPLVGIVSAAVRTTHSPDDARLAHCACGLASSRRILGDTTVDYGGGSHPDAARARAAALGDAIERYSATFVPRERLVRTTAAALGRRAVGPERFALFHPRQHEARGFPFQQFGRETRLAFVEGFSLADREPAFLPAQLVYLGTPSAGDARIGYPTSSGLACGPTLEEATLAALLELVERDAVMIQWSNRLSPPRLDWRDDPEILALERRHFAPSRLRYSVLDGSKLSGLPVAIAVVHGPEGEPASLAMGAGCAPRVAQAWLKALSEAFSVYRWLCTKIAQQPVLAVPAAELICSFDEHMLFYGDVANARLAAFLDASPKASPTAGIAELTGATPRALIEELLDRVARIGTSAYAVDVTSPDVASLGLHVVRALVPELCPLDVVHAARYLGGRRLYHAAFDAGLADAPLRFEDVNPLPHPFP